MQFSIIKFPPVLPVYTSIIHISIVSLRSELGFVLQKIEIYLEQSLNVTCFWWFCVGEIFREKCSVNPFGIRSVVAKSSCNQSKESLLPCKIVYGTKTHFSFGKCVLEKFATTHRVLLLCIAACLTLVDKQFFLKMRARRSAHVINNCFRSKHLVREILSVVKIPEFDPENCYSFWILEAS